VTLELIQGNWLDQVHDTMSEAGLRPVSPLVADGAIHRFHVDGDRRGSRNGWYVLHQDDRPAGAFGSMRTGERFNWSAKGTRPLCREEREALAQKAKQRREEAAAAEMVRWEAAAKRALAMWEAAEPVVEHAYLSRKGVGGHGLRVGTFIRQLSPGPDGEPRSRAYSGALLIPLWDTSKRIWNLQAIFPESVSWCEDSVREKAFVYGARKQGLWYSIGKPAHAEATVVLVEGYATAATVYAATRLPTLVVFDAGNLVPVAKVVRRVRPDARLLIAADNDQWTTIGGVARNTGVEKATLAGDLSGGEVVVPRFNDTSGKPTDFNDLQNLEGLDAVSQQFREHLAPPCTGQAGDISGLDVQEPLSDDGPRTMTSVTIQPVAGPPSVGRRVIPKANLGEDRLSEDAMAEVLANEMRDALRYCHSEGRWFTRSGGIWERDHTGEAFELTRQIVRRLSAEAEKPQRYRSSKFVHGVASFASRDPLLSRDSTFWDTDRLLLGVPGQVLDLRTGQPVPPDPQYGITRSTKVAPAPTADCPRWLAFLRQATGGDTDTITFLRRFFGSCLTGETRDQTLLFIHGDGGNGKGVFMDVIREILGTYAATATTDMLMESKFPKHSTDLAMLKGARLAVASETDQGTAWAESRIKLMTGSDPITARFMRKDNFTYLPEFKLVVIGNHMPTLKNVDAAIRRRFRVVPFVHKPSQVDKHLREKLRAEAPEILRWLLDGCLEWQREGLGGSMVIEEATRSYLGDQDLHNQWLDECCVVRRQDGALRAAVSDLYESFSAFAKAGGEVPGTKKALSSWLAAAGFTPARTGQVRMMAGLRLRTHNDE
jgi:putative DNA primase/helicase